MAEPVLKWAGGKRQLLDELYRRLPAAFDAYHEPMVGGGALFFDLAPDDGTISDTNPRLVGFYEQVRDRPDDLIARLREFSGPESAPDPELAFSETGRDGSAVQRYYYQQRERFNRRPNGEAFDDLEEAALLLYLNRTCYNGLYRENRSGEFNVPVGRYTNPDWVRADAIRAASRVLDGTTVHGRDVAYVDEAAESGDLVYLDPPYEPTSPTASFTDYSAEGFDREDQTRLLDLARRLDSRGVGVVLSNSGVTYDRYDEAGFDVDRVGATRAINSDGANRDEVAEIVATNVPPAERGRRGQARLGEY